jgi:sugar/nucleoside kinase (ribokinase family)
MDRPWETVDGMKNDHVIDTEGAGDWFSSAFINALAEAPAVWIMRR